MTVPAMAVVRLTDALTDDVVASFAAAAQIAISRDFAPHWGDATITYYKPGEMMPGGVWQCRLEEHAPPEDADDLGFHTTAEGWPIMRVFVLDALADGVHWTVSATHEIMETIADPLANQTVRLTDAAGVTWDYAREVADPPEDDKWAYWVAGPDGRSHLCSAFVTPAYFVPGAPGPYSFPAVPGIDAPFKLAEGGYASRIEVAPNPGQWTQLMARGAPGPRTRKGPFSRTMRRFRRPDPSPAA